MHSTIATLQIHQTALARRHTEKKVSIESRLILMTNAASVNKSICSHPFEIESDVLYNIVNGQVAPAVVNVWDALALVALKVTAFRKSLPAGFHAKLSSPVKTTAKLKHGIKIGDQEVFDLETIFLRLLLVGQQREMELLSVFGYELCAVPQSLVDEYGCLRKGNMAVLMHLLGVKQCQLQRPDVVIVDAHHLLYHVVWPCGGSVCVRGGVGRVAASAASIASCY